MTKEEAIERLKQHREEFKCDHGWDYTTIDALDMAIKALEQEPKTGHWIWQTDDKYQCSCCGEVIRVKEVMNEPQYITCPMCDARMVEPQERSEA